MVGMRATKSDLARHLDLAARSMIAQDEIRHGPIRSSDIGSIYVNYVAACADRGCREEIEPFIKEIVKYQSIFHGLNVYQPQALIEMISTIKNRWASALQELVKDYS